MSNFICPTCGFNNIDCGKAGYKTAREIELEKKLGIAIEALESAFGGFKTIQHMAAYPITHFSHPKSFDCLFSGAVDKSAEIKEALAKIKEKNIDN